MKSSTPVLLLLAFASGSISAPTSSYGVINEPTAGTAVQPGANFNFAYSPHADYGISSFAYHVWLLTAARSAVDPTNPLASLTALDATGYYFGRFDYPNYPGMHERMNPAVCKFVDLYVAAVPYAKNPAPPQLTMPDFSQSPGGFAAGATASNLDMQLIVIEEWGNGDVRDLWFAFLLADIWCVLAHCRSTAERGVN